MPLRSQIAAIVANNMGRIQGELESRIQTEVVKQLQKFASECPNVKTLKQVAKVRNNILKAINGFQKTTNSFSSIPRKLRPPISAAKQLIKLLKRNPTKLAIGAKPSFSDFDKGGLIAAKTAGFTNKQADRLIKVTLLLEDLEDDLAAVNGLLAGVQPSINNTKELLSSIDFSINDCAKELSDAAELKDLLNSTQPLESELSTGGTASNTTFRANSGSIYKLEIIKDESIDGPLLRRTAVAKDNRGIIVLRGQPSFSSDTNVLLEEIKFRINNQLP